jgi:hypothetical protein
MEKNDNKNNILKYIDENKLLLLSLLFFIILLISINFDIYSNYTINLFNNLYFKFTIFLIFIHLMTKNFILALILIVILLFILQKVSIHNITNEFNENK